MALGGRERRTVREPEQCVYFTEGLLETVELDGGEVIYQHYVPLLGVVRDYLSEDWPLRGKLYLHLTNRRQNLEGVWYAFFSWTGGKRDTLFISKTCLARMIPYEKGARCNQVQSSAEAGWSICSDWVAHQVPVGLYAPDTSYRREGTSGVIYVGVVPAVDSGVSASSSSSD